jgi:UDPglucose 6-dehydrogenase
MKVVVIGTGYVGLVTGTCFAEVGVDVTCVDIDQKKIENLKNGILPIYEPGLEEMVLRNTQKHRLHFSTSLEESIMGAEVAFIAVGTPPDEDGSADLKYVLAVAAGIGLHMQKPLVVVTKSTVPVTTAEKVRKAVQSELDKRGSKLDFYVASNPEFLKEGAAIDDFMKPDRIVVGTDRHEAEEIMRKLYKPFLLNGHPIIFMDIPSAEMTKYAANAMLATRISFMNELAGLCEKLDANIEHVRIGIGSDKRIGPQFLQAGVGFGGSCFPKDIRALKAVAQSVSYVTPILEAVEEVNKNQKKLLAEKIGLYFKDTGGVQGKTIAVWGLAFKPNTDDIREAPALELIQELIFLGAHLRLFDPVAMENAKLALEEHKEISWCSSEYEASIGADAIALLTEWPQFRSADLLQILSSMKGKAMFDGRNQYHPAKMRETGFHYFGIGMPKG